MAIFIFLEIIRPVSVSCLCSQSFPRTRASWERKQETETGKIISRKLFAPFLSLACEERENDTIQYQ